VQVTGERVREIARRTFTAANRTVATLERPAPPAVAPGAPGAPGGAGEGGSR